VFDLEDCLEILESIVQELKDSTKKKPEITSVNSK